MIKPRIALGLILLALITVPVLPAQERPADKKSTELESKMEKMNGAWRKLRRQIADPAMNASSLELLAKVRAAAAGAEKLTPIKAADVPEADRAKFQADYAAGMKKLDGLFGELEAALKAGNNEEANKLFNNINDFQRESHKAFRRPPPEKK